MNRQPTIRPPHNAPTFGATAVLALAIINSPAAVISGQPCDALQAPSTFDQSSAMAAVFCAYDRVREGTLLPVEFTTPWAPEKAETLATPMLAATYRERGSRKGVLVVQRQIMFDGEPATGHAQSAVVSVYVFQQHDRRWMLGTRHDEALDIGAYGVAPAPELIRVGPDRYGLWFAGGHMNQGYTNAYAHLVTISGPRILAAGAFEMGGGNSGACSDDPRERNDFIHACWEWSTTLDFVRLSGRGDYMLRLTTTGTFVPDISQPDRVAAKKSVACYVNDGGTFTPRADSRCASYPAVDKREIFGTP